MKLIKMGKIKLGDDCCMVNQLGQAARTHNILGKLVCSRLDCDGVC